MLRKDTEPKPRWRPGCGKGGYTRDLCSPWILNIMSPFLSQSGSVLSGTAPAPELAHAGQLCRLQVEEPGLCRLPLGTVLTVALQGDG